MSLTPRYENWLFRGAWLAVWLVIFEGILLLNGYLAIPIGAAARAVNNSTSIKWPETRAPLSSDWFVFQKCDTAGVVPGSQTLKRFRLVGTFFVYEEGAQDTRRAVLDDLKDRTQRTVSESEDLGGITVAKILRDSVTLRASDGQEEELLLGFSGLGSGTNATADAQLSAGGTPDTKFGAKQVGERSWIVSRKALLDYYQELRDEPQRLVNVFDSLKPLYDPADTGRITGYKLGIEGEADLFAAAGLQEGDIVRKVNETPMTNRKAAERMIGDFVNDSPNANAYVFEIERAGVRQKLVYQTR